MRQQEARKYLRTQDVKKQTPPTPPSPPSPDDQPQPASADTDPLQAVPNAPQADPKMTQDLAGPGPDLASSDKEDSSTISSEKSEMSLTEAIADLKQDQTKGSKGVTLKAKIPDTPPKTNEQ